MPESPNAEQVEEEMVISSSANPESSRGVLYIPRVPPYMHAPKLRHLLSSFGEIGRIYLTPEDDTDYEKRVKSGGQKKTLYKDGWIEFMNKKVAKRVTESLNGTPIGGKKGHNFYRDDIWTLRYLCKFTWSDLNEHLMAKRDNRQKRLGQRQQRAEKEDEFYLKNVLKAQAIERKKKRKQPDEETRIEKDWTFRQKSVKSDHKVSQGLLDSIAG